MRFKLWFLYRENLENVNNLANAQSWLDPNGIFYPISRYEGSKFYVSHGHYASQKLKTNIHELFDNGWMRVIYIGDILYASNDSNVPLNNIQRKNLIDFAIFSRKFKEIFYEGGDGEDKIVWSREE